MPVSLNTRLCVITFGVTVIKILLIGGRKMIRFKDFVNAIDSKSVRFLIIDEPSKSYVIC